MPSGFIPLSRQFLNWRWFTEPNVCHLFIYFLLRANQHEVLWHKTLIHKGELVSSLSHIAQQTGLSVWQVRLALKSLEETKIIKVTHTADFSIYHIENYEEISKDCFYLTRWPHAGHKLATS